MVERAERMSVAKTQDQDAKKKERLSKGSNTLE
jgi:hypothetical protein